MGKSNAINKQVNLAAFTGICVAMSCGLLVLQSMQDIALLGRAPDEESERSTATAQVHGGDRMSSSSRLSINGSKVELGEGATITFATNANGVALIPLSMERAGAAPGSNVPFSFMNAMGGNRLAWSGSEVELSGLRPMATYKVSAALWLWGQGASREDPSKAEGPYRVFTSKQSYAPDCQERCVVGLGLPSLVSLQTAPLWEKIEVAALAHTFFLSPMLLALMGLAWRPKLRPLVRKGLVSVGLGTALPMRIGVSSVG